MKEYIAKEDLLEEIAQMVKKETFGELMSAYGVGLKMAELVIERFPTATKADICREFKTKLKEYIEYLGDTPVIEVHRLYQVLAEMEKKE